MLINLIRIGPFISLTVCFCRSWKDLTCYRLTNHKISCKCFGAVGKRMLPLSMSTKCVVSTTIWYTHFHWLFYKLKRSWQEVTRTCLKRGCVRSFHERQKQKKSEMKGLILIRLGVDGFSIAKKWFIRKEILASRICFKEIHLKNKKTCTYIFTMFTCVFLGFPASRACCRRLCWGLCGI